MTAGSADERRVAATMEPRRCQPRWWLRTALTYALAQVAIVCSTVLLAFRFYNLLTGATGGSRA